MKIKYIAIALAGLFFTMKSLAQESSIRLASYNICACRGLDDYLDEERTLQILHSLGADVIAVQEVDSCTERTGKVDQLKMLGKKLDMHPCYIKNIDFQGGGYGVGILSREKPKSIKRIPLPGVEARGIIICEFENYVYACTHLCVQSEENRLASVEVIQKEAAQSKKPFFVAGDLNAKPDSKVINKLKEKLVVLTRPEMPTYPSGMPKECIDYIATNNAQVQVLHCEVIDDTTASDHCPLVVDVMLP